MSKNPTVLKELELAGEKLVKFHRLSRAFIGKACLIIIFMNEGLISDGFMVQLSAYSIFYYRTAYVTLSQHDID